MTASATVSALQPGARLACLQQIATRLASGINNALTVLRDNAEYPDAAHLVCDALERLGWMADQAAMVAGSTLPPVCGDADQWLLAGLLHGAVNPSEGAAL